MKISFMSYWDLYPTDMIKKGRYSIIEGYDAFIRLADRRIREALRT